MYKYSNIAGKIVKGAAPIAQGLKPAAPEASKIIFESPNVKFPKIASTFVKPTKSGYGELSDSLVEKYRRFQADDGTPVHLKGGQTDAALYYTTLVMCAIGIEECLRYYYFAAFPKKD